MNMMDFEAARKDMVKRQISARGVGDPLVLDAMRSVPRVKISSCCAGASKPPPVPARVQQASAQGLTLAGGKYPLANGPTHTLKG